jgi:hypothetical protein
MAAGACVNLKYTKTLVIEDERLPEEPHIQNLLSAPSFKADPVIYAHPRRDITTYTGYSGTCLQMCYVAFDWRYFIMWNED